MATTLESTLTGIDKTYDFSHLDRFMVEYAERAGGGFALILIQDREVIFRKSIGEDWTPDRVVPLASSTKGISGTVIMSLVDREKFDLDDTYSQYLPAYTGKKGEITIRQGFSHTHGFPEGPQHHRNTKITMDEAVRRFLEIDLIADPGTALYYSGIGMQIDGKIAEIVTGKDWMSIFRENIGDPLGMDNTDYFAFGETTNPNVAGSGRTNIDDYGKLVWMLANDGVFEGKRILSQAAVRTLLSNQTDDYRVLRHPGAPYKQWNSDFATSRYGIGWWLEQLDAEGNASFATSGGAFGAQPFIDLTRHLAGVYLPYVRNMRMIEQGLAVNDASVVFLEMLPVLRRTIPVRAEAG